MGHPIAHFEVIGRDPKKLRSYYGGRTQRGPTGTHHAVLGVKASGHVIHLREHLAPGELRFASNAATFSFWLIAPPVAATSARTRRRWRGDSSR